MRKIDSVLHVTYRFLQLCRYHNYSLMHFIYYHLIIAVSPYKTKQTWNGGVYIVYIRIYIRIHFNAKYIFFAIQLNKQK